MKRVSIAVALLLVPAALLAQGRGTGSVQASAHANAQADAHANAHAAMKTDAQATVPSNFSAGARGKLEATYAMARQHNLPEAAIQHRVAEGQAKGASEAAIVAAAGKVEANMQAAQEAMVKAGHQHPTDAEIESAAGAMDRGASAAQIGTVASHAQNGRSLDVAFDVLTKLSESGMPVTTALAQVQAKLDANASNASIASLVSKGKVGVHVGGGR
ncbi:MAG TPA: hypothetical protein VF737_07275 [Gemmatimonadaceae bacterium]